MSWKQFAEDYLTFSKKERIAAIVVLLMVASLYLLPRLFPKNRAAIELQVDSTLLIAIENKKADAGRERQETENVSNSFYEPSVNTHATGGELFYFDPNTLSAEGWQKLGLSNRTTKTLLNYRNKGGRFYKKEDLKKIWGLPAAFYNRVENYITLEDNRPQFSNNFSNTQLTYNNTSKGFRNISVVQVNTADTAALIALPGIGSKLAARIVAFRDKLGGFYATDQIGETYGLPDSTFQVLKPYLQVDAGAIKKINLNTATKDELRNHPYIKWQLANAIVEYRNQHGNFNSLEELKNIMLIDEATFNKITPYLNL